MSPAVDKEILDLLTKTGTFSDGLLRGRMFKGPPSYHSLLALYDRCRSLSGAIRLLLAYDFVHEAIILARPLFTDSLALAEVAAADLKGRDEFAVRLNMTGVAQGEGLFRSTGEKDALRALAEERAEIERYARLKGLSTKGWQPDDQAKELASKHGRAGEYVDLRVADHFVHGSTKATSERVSRQEDGTVVVGGRARTAEWANPTALFAIHSALCAARAGCCIFEWPEPPEVEELMEELIEARATGNDEDGTHDPGDPSPDPPR